MNNTKALLVLAVLGLLAGVLGVGALYWLEDGPLDSGSEPGQGHRLPETGPQATLRGETANGGPGSPTSADRREIAGNHSRSLRRVLVQLRCETLRHNVAGVWNHLQLRVSVEDESGRRLAECDKPWLPWTFSIPADVDRVALVAKGYKRKVIAAPPTSRDGDKPTVVSLEPDALARVRAINLPWTPGNRFGVAVRLATGVDKQGQPLLYANAYPGGRGSEPLRGQIIAEVKIPSGLAAMFVVHRTHRAAAETDGFIGLDSEIVTLAPGEEREITVDLRAYGVLEGRVTGLARPALKDQVLSLGIAAESSAGQGDSGPRTWKNFKRPDNPGLVHLPNYRRGGNEIVLDADGHFRVAGLPKRPITLRLRTEAGAWPALKEVGSDRRQWQWDESGFLVLEPATPVHGVVPVKQGRLLGEPFKVQVNTPPDSRYLATRIPLFPTALLERATLYFFVEGIGHFDRSLAGKLPDPDGLHRVEVPVPGGSLVAHVQNQPGSGLHLFVRPVALSKKAPWLAITGKRTDHDWRFEGLAPGEYQLVVSYTAAPRANRGIASGIHSGRTLKETVVVRSGEETRVTVQMPELLEILGDIVNWRDIPTSLTPRWLQLNHGGRPHNVRIDKNGGFQLMVMGPWEGVSEVTFFGQGMLATLKTTDITWLPGEKRLSVVFPGGIHERWVTVTPIAGGRLWMHTYLAESGEPPRRSPRRHGRHLSPKKNNRFLIPDVPGGVDVLVLEQLRKDGTSLRLLRGWFRLRPGGPQDVTLAPKGRFVQVSMATPEARATLTLKPPAWWQHPPYPWASLRLAGTTPQQLWIPDEATAILVDNQREIPIASVGRQLIID